MGADTVIFYDHDWNPANDSQAMDRAYRIGQTRNVTVYRLISAGTIEDKILERQASKQALAAEVVGSTWKVSKTSQGRRLPHCCDMTHSAGYWRPP